MLFMDEKEKEREGNAWLNRIQGERGTDAEEWIIIVFIAKRIYVAIQKKLI